MKKSSHLKKNSFLLSRQKKILVKKLFFVIIILACIIYILHLVGNRAWPWLNDKNYNPLITKRINAPIDFNIFFNDVVGDDVLSSRIIAAIDSARSSIKIAMFALTSPQIISALDRADKRGVIIKLVYDESNRNRYAVALGKFFDTGMARGAGVDNPKHNIGYYMHHKFIIIDEGFDDEQLITGSLNWTDWQQQYDPSYFIITRRPEIINIYNQEFMRLWRGQSGVAKLRDNDYQPWIGEFKYNNATLELWWGPGFKENSYRQRLLDLITAATQSIEVAIWQLTDRDIAQALLVQATKGVSVAIVTDDYTLWSRDSAFPYLIKQKEQLGLDNLIIASDSWRSVDLDNIYKIVGRDFFNSYFHRHGALIDNKILALGTANWSYRGFWSNDESGLVTDDFDMIQAWQQSWDYHYHSLQAQELHFFKNEQVLTLGDKFDQFYGKNLLAICELSGDSVKPLILSQTILADLNQKIMLKGDCPNVVQVFIYDDNNKLLGAGRAN
ncbi:MAG: phospholipase D-like domain-containing protein [Candidatus Komeilibacteria bacterium]